MNRQSYVGVSNAISSKSQLLSKQNEKVSDNTRHRRRSRLGTYRASLVSQEILLDQEKTDLKDNVLSQKKVFPVSSSPDTFNQNNNGVKKRLFTRSPISRRLNMDMSSINLPSETHTCTNDPDVTGVCVIANAESVRKVHQEFEEKNFNSRKYLSSLENNSLGILRSAKKTTPLRLFSQSKSTFLVSPKNNNSVKKNKDYSSYSHQLTLLSRRTVKTPSPPKLFPFRYPSQKVIKTPPELTQSTADIIAAIRKRHSIINVDDCESTEDSKVLKQEVSNVKISDVQDNLSSSTENEDKFPVREAVCSRLFDDENVNDRLDMNNKYNNFVPNPKLCSTFKNLSINYDPNNSLEAAYAKANGTYNIIETSTKNKEQLSDNCEFSTNNTFNALEINCSENDVAESNKNRLEESSSHDRSQSVVFKKNINVTYELDDSTETFVYNESLCNDKTLTYDEHDNNILTSSSNGDGSTIKKKKLSMIVEETAVVNVLLPHSGKPLSKPDYSGNSSLKNLIHSFNTSEQVTSVESNDKINNVAGSNLVLNNILSKLCDTVKHIEKTNEKHNRLFKKQEELLESYLNGIKDLKLENEQLLKEKSDLTNSLNGLINDVRGLIDCQKGNRNLFNSTVISNSLQDSKNEISSVIPVCDVKTPDHNQKVLSKSVYNQLKTEYSCLKTPKLSTVKKTSSSSRKILTPHSMSLCVQDQVDQLFDSLT